MVKEIAFKLSSSGIGERNAGNGAVNDKQGLYGIRMSKIEQTAGFFAELFGRKTVFGAQKSRIPPREFTL